MSPSHFHGYRENMMHCVGHALMNYHTDEEIHNAEADEEMAHLRGWMQNARQREKMKPPQGLLGTPSKTKIIKSVV